LEKHDRISNKSRNLKKISNLKQTYLFEKKSRIGIQCKNLRKMKEFEKIEEFEQN